MTTLCGMRLARLLQLASPALPVGAFSYSQGLEAAADAGLVCDEASALRWILDVLEHPVGRCEAPLLAGMMRCWRVEDASSAEELNALFLATRETAELRAETLQMGYSLIQLLASLNVFAHDRLARVRAVRDPTFPVVFGFAADSWAIPVPEALVAYLWSWTENQAMAAMKTIPLGQAAGQRILFAAGARLDAVAARAMVIGPGEISSFAPMLSIQSSRHETQYSRLFRS